MSAILSARGLERRFGGLKAVNDLSLDVTEGEIFGIIGPNGAGKTTLFNLLSGVVSTSKGEIEFLGQRVEKLPVHRRSGLGMGRTFQTSQLFGGLTVRENYEIAQVGGQRGISGLFRSSRSSRAIYSEDVGLSTWELSDQQDRPAGELALFDQQRLAIAMALATGAKILLLDEPSGGLVEREVQDLLTLIRTVRDRGTTVLVIDHKMRLMMQLCDRIMVMAVGTEVMTGTPHEVANDARVRELYFGNAPVMGAQAEAIFEEEV